MSARDHLEISQRQEERDVPLLSEWQARRWGVCSQTGFALAHAGGILEGCRETYQCDLCGEVHRLSRSQEGNSNAKAPSRNVSRS